MIILQMSDMVGTFNVHHEDKRFNQKQLNAMKQWNKFVESSWYHPKNLYKAYKSPAGKILIRGIKIALSKRWIK